MLRSIHDLRGFTLRATDGTLGSADNFLFDDAHWTIRYLVANTGSWLAGRLVLISPLAFRAVDWDRRCIDVDLTREQIEHSPSIDTDKPVARQREEELFRYYGYPYYWIGPGMWGMGMYPNTAAMAAFDPYALEATSQANEQPRGDPHLRSAREVIGYAIHARDGDVGHVEDFLADDMSWAIRYLVVGTRNWWPGRRVLIGPKAIRTVSWEQARVAVDLTRDAIKHGPEYERARPPDID